MDKLKNGFVMYDTYIQAAEMLSDADFKEFILKIRDYALYGIDEPSQNPFLNGLMVMVKVGLDSTEQRRLKCIENGKKGAEFGKLGGRPRKDETKSESPIKPQERDNEKTQETTDEITPKNPQKPLTNPQKPLTNPLKEKEEREKEKEERIKDNKDILSISTSTTSYTEKENQEIENLKNSIVLEDLDDDDLSFNEETKSTKNSTSTSFSSSSLSSFPNTGKTSNLYYQEIHKKVNPNDKDTMNLSDYAYEEIAKGIETIAFEYRIPNKKFDTRCKDIFFTCLRQLQDLTGVDEDRGKEILKNSINNIVVKNSNKLANVSTGLI